jgi:hypothetical protein
MRLFAFIRRISSFVIVNIIIVNIIIVNTITMVIFSTVAAVGLLLLLLIGVIILVMFTMFAVIIIIIAVIIIIIVFVVILILLILVILIVLFLVLVAVGEAVVLVAVGEAVRLRFVKRPPSVTREGAILRELPAVLCHQRRQPGTVKVGNSQDGVELVAGDSPFPAPNKRLELCRANVRLRSSPSLRVPARRFAFRRAARSVFCFLSP